MHGDGFRPPAELVAAVEIDMLPGDWGDLLEESGALHITGALFVNQQMDELWHRREQGVLIKTLMKDYRLSKASGYRYVSETDSCQSAKTT